MNYNYIICYVSPKVPHLVDKPLPNMETPEYPN